jgi:hypothetical protein
LFPIFQSALAFNKEEKKMAAVEESVLPQADKGKMSWVPTTKVGTGVVAGSFTTLLLPVLKKVNLESPESLVAVTTLITFAMQYLIPERK